MTDEKSADDPFSTLYSQLPANRPRTSATGETPASAEPRTETAPLTRRELRERLTRETTGQQQPAPDAAPVSPTPASRPPRVTSQPDTLHPASLTGVTPAPAAAMPPSGSTPPPVTRPPERTAPVGAARASAPGDLADLFTGRASSDTVGAVPKKPSKRRRRARGWIALAIVVALLGGIGAGGVWVWNTYGDKVRSFMGWEEPADYATGLANGEALLTIASGDTGMTISTKLYQAGVTKTSSVFYNMLVKSQQNPNFQPGVYKLQKQMTAAAALAAIQDPANRQQNTALIREGLTVSQIAQALSDDLTIPLADVQAAVKTPSDYGVSADSLEGWLFPATYTFDPGTTATQAVKAMVDRTKQSLQQAGVAASDQQRILTIASIIQREARQSADFYKVSRVIQNRLADGMKLQMDSTAQYGYGEMHDGSVSSSAAALADNNPWNTYVITGLPKGPISNPGDTAIDAAVHPADGPWLYFVTVNLDTGETVFSTTDAEHEAAVAQWRSWCAQNPNSGC